MAPARSLLPSTMSLQQPEFTESCDQCLLLYNTLVALFEFGVFKALSHVALPANLSAPSMTAILLKRGKMSLERHRGPSPSKKFTQALSSLYGPATLQLKILLG